MGGRLAHIYIPDLGEHEEVIFVLRRHSVVALVNFLAYAVLLAVPLVVRWFLLREFPLLFVGPISQPLLYLLASVYYFYVWIYFFAIFIDYWLDIWIVTTERIVSLEQKGMFSRVFSEQQLYRIQDVTSRVSGFFATILRYGDIVAQAAGTVQNAQLKQVGHPDLIARKIMQLVEDAKRRHPAMAAIAEQDGGGRPEE